VCLFKHAGRKSRAAPSAGHGQLAGDYSAPQPRRSAYEDSIQRFRTEHGKDVWLLHHAIDEYPLAPQDDREPGFLVRCVPKVRLDHLKVKIIQVLLQCMFFGPKDEQLSESRVVIESLRREVCSFGCPRQRGLGFAPFGSLGFEPKRRGSAPGRRLSGRARRCHRVTASSARCAHRMEKPWMSVRIFFALGPPIGKGRGKVGAWCQYAPPGPRAHLSSVSSPPVRESGQVTHDRRRSRLVDHLVKRV
jgi:hypothetical protein